MDWSVEVLDLVGSSPILVKVSSRHCQSNLSDHAVSAGVCLLNSRQPPEIPCCVVILHHNDVALSQVSVTLVPFSSLLKTLEILVSPATPEFICQMLNSAPHLAGVKICLLKDTGGRHEHLCLERQEVVRREWFW